MAGGVHHLVFYVSFTILSPTLVQVSSALRPHPPCAWNEYYDENVGNCGPCREMCNGMHVSGTTKQCRQQCSGYLVSLSCKYDEYYDEVVQNCAPCHELCVKRNWTHTTGDCYSKCRVYLTVTSCTADEYFNEKGKTCASCSDLCSHHDGTGIPDECFQKCPKYRAINPALPFVGDNQPGPGDPSESREGPPRDSSWASTHPGIIVTIIIGMLAVAVVVGVALYRKFKSSPKNYRRAPRHDAGGDGEDAGGDKQHNEVRLQMADLGPPVPVSSEDVTQQPAFTEALYDGRGDVSSSNGQQSGVRYGIPECDPLAPTSAACQHVIETVTVL